MSDFILLPVDDDGCMGPIFSGCCLVGCAWILLGGLGAGAAAGSFIAKGVKALRYKKMERMK